MHTGHFRKLELTPRITPEAAVTCSFHALTPAPSLYGVLAF